MTIKSPYLSKTMWLNIIGFIVLILALPQLGSVIPVSWVPYDALILAIGNTALRYFSTSQPISQIAVNSATPNA